MQLVDRVLKSIEILSKEESGMSVSELSEALEIPASSTHRVLKSLQSNHFVIQNMETKKYSLSYKIYSICSGMRENSSLIALARPYMKRLVEEIHYPVVLCVLNGEKIINLDCVENSNASIYMVQTGNELPLYNTSSGRVFAAYMPPECAYDILNRTDRCKKTPHTKTEMSELMKELEEIRKQGYAIIDEELQIGIQGISCPITDYRGTVIAAIATTTVKSEKSINESLIEKVKTCADRISEEIS